MVFVNKSNDFRNDPQKRSVHKRKKTIKPVNIKPVTNNDKTPIINDRESGGRTDRESGEQSDKKPILSDKKPILSDKKPIKNEFLVPPRMIAKIQQKKDYQTKDALYRREIYDLIKIGNVQKKTIAQNLGVSRKKLEWFLSGKNLHYVIWNYPIFLREHTTGHAFTKLQFEQFWNFIHTNCKSYTNFNTEMFAIEISLNYTREELDLFENILWYLVRKLGIYLLNDRSHLIDTDRAITIVLRGSSFYKACMQKTFPKTTDLTPKQFIQQFTPTSNHTQLFQKLKTPNIPLYLLGTKLFPFGLPLTTPSHVTPNILDVQMQ